jgi:hypothetical protein
MNSLNLSSGFSVEKPESLNGLRRLTLKNEIGLN